MEVQDWEGIHSISCMGALRRGGHSDLEIRGWGWKAKEQRPQIRTTPGLRSAGAGLSCVYAEFKILS